MSKRIEQAANAVMEALGLQKEWATVIHPLREQGFTVELLSTMDRINAAVRGSSAKTSFECLKEIQMVLDQTKPSSLEAALRDVLERFGCNRPVALALAFAQMAQTLQEND